MDKHKSMMMMLSLLMMMSLMVQATHFRFGSISWEHKAGGNGRFVEFTVDMAWRRTFFLNGDFVVGDTVTETSKFYPDEDNEDDFTQLVMEVNVINSAADWFIGTLVYEYEYENDGTFIAMFEGGDRISTLINNPDGKFRVSAQVVIDAGQTRQSIRTTNIPIVTALINEPVGSQITALSVEDEFLTYRFANRREAASGNSYSQISGLDIDSDTGSFTWTPTQVGLYSTQVVIEGRENQNSNDADTFVVVDFIFSVIEDTGNVCKHPCFNGGDPCSTDDDCTQCEFDDGTPVDTPTCDANTAPTFSSITANGVELGVASIVEYEAPSNEELVIVITATDNDEEDEVLIVSTAIPTGAMVDVVEDNPGTSTLTITPDDNGDFLICYTATDSVFNTAPGQVCISVTVAEGALTAEGEGLTFTVAGVETEVYIFNTAGRDHSLDIVGAITAEANIVETSSGEYTATYNVDGDDDTAVEKSGFFALTITDNDGGDSLAFSLLCAPAETDPSMSLPFDSGTTGLTGGFSESTVSFSIQSKDEFGNEVVESIGGVTLESPLGPDFDSYFSLVSYTPSADNSDAAGQTFDEADSVHNGDGEFMITYTLPRVIVSDVYSLSVYHRNTDTGVETLVQTFTDLDVFGQDFTVEIEDLADEIVAGEAFTFNLVASDEQAHAFTVTVLGEDAVVDTDNIVDGVHPVSFEGVTTADTFIDAISAVAPGIAQEARSGLVVVPADPSGPNCVIDDDFNGLFEGSAGEDLFFAVQLRDEFDNKIIDEVDGIRVVLTSISTLDDFDRVMTFDDEEFEFEYTVNDADIIIIDVTLVSTGEPVADSPYSFTVDPGEFSFTDSALSGSFSAKAGDSVSVILTANDGFGNDRLAGVDTFDTTFSKTSGTGAVTSGDSSWSAALESNEYFVAVSATEKGVYELELNVYVPSQFTFLEFREVNVEITPGDVVPENSYITGSGLDGGTEGTDAILLFQARDLFENAVEEKGDDFFIVQIAPAEDLDSDEDFEDFETEYYIPGYTFPGGERDVDFGEFELFTRFAGLDDLTPEEQLLQDDGFWGLYYPIPDIGDSSYQITVGYIPYSAVNFSASGEENFASEEITIVSTTMTASVAAVEPGTGDVDAFSDDWELIAVSVGAGACVLSLVGYGAWRLQRYRPKYLSQRKRADSAERALAEMADEIDVIQGGRDYEAVGAATVSANPLHPAYHLKHGPNEEVELIDAPDGVIKPQEKRNAFRKEIAPANFQPLAADLDSDDE